MKTDIITADDFESAIGSVLKTEKLIREFHEQISQEKTPDARVKNFMGFDYVDEAWMRNRLSHYYPIWSWEPAGEVKFIGAEWIVTDGVLVILDNGVTRKFYSPGAARIQFKVGMPHTPENVTDIDNNIAASNTNAFKRAVNRLANISDDVYRKVIEDYALTKEEEARLKELAKRAGPDTLQVIVGKLQNGEIDKANYEKVIVYLRKQIAQKTMRDKK